MLLQMLPRLKQIVRRFGIVERIIGWYRSQRSYSQFAEDVYLQSFYRGLLFKKNIRVDYGIIADVGAHRPVRLSNSYLFYRAGWLSINIDPAPSSKKLFDSVRPRDINLQLAISPNSGQGNLYVFGMQSLYNTLSVDRAMMAQKTTGIEPDIVSVRIVPLSEIFQQYIDPANFEILMVDAEGLDLVVLQTNDWNQFRPRIVLIEVHDVDSENLGKHPVCIFLKDQGYKLFAHINPNMMFVRNDSLW
jgi:hypothetical protein